MIDGYVYKQAAIDAISCDITVTGRQNAELVAATIGTFADRIKALPSADVVNKTDLLGWLLAYHTKSFELKGRYPSHEVISWLVNDLSMYLFEDGEQSETD